MKPVIVISDVHENLSWKDMIAGREPGDRVVFLGDYFDQRGKGPWADDPIENFLEICDYAEKNPDTWLLAGNHDYMYMPWSIQIEEWTPRDLAIQKAVMEKIDLLKMVFVERSCSTHPFIFSHGGVTNTFLAMHGLKEPEELNELWIAHPEAFEWRPTNPAKTQMSSVYGDDPWQSPIWARTQALFEDGLRGFNQVVGHTPVSQKGLMDTKWGDRVLLTCDFGGDTLKLSE